MLFVRLVKIDFLTPLAQPSYIKINVINQLSLILSIRVGPTTAAGMVWAIRPLQLNMLPA